MFCSVHLTIHRVAEVGLATMHCYSTVLLQYCSAVCSNPTSVFSNRGILSLTPSPAIIANSHGFPAFYDISPNLPVSGGILCYLPASDGISTYLPGSDGFLCYLPAPLAFHAICQLLIAFHII